MTDGKRLELGRSDVHKVHNRRPMTSNNRRLAHVHHLHARHEARERVAPELCRFWKNKIADYIISFQQRR